MIVDFCSEKITFSAKKNDVIFHILDQVWRTPLWTVHASLHTFMASWNYINNPFNNFLGKFISKVNPLTGHTFSGRGHPFTRPSVCYMYVMFTWIKMYLGDTHTKELSLFSSPYIFATWWFKLLIFQLWLFDLTDFIVWNI